jgi:zona occludens toxin (predicted ATPase)
MTWPRVVALALLVAGAVTAAALHNNVIAATLAGAAAGFAVNREPVADKSGTAPPTY